MRRPRAIIADLQEWLYQKNMRWALDRQWGWHRPWWRRVADWLTGKQP